MLQLSKTGRTVLLCALLLPATARAQPSDTPAIPVVVEPIQRGEVAQSVSLAGTAVADRISVVAAQVEGPVAEVPVREGDLVRKGDPLAVLRQVPFRLRVQEFRASLKAMRARHEQAVDDLERQRDLFRREVISERQLVEAEKTEQALIEESRRLEASLAWAEDQLALSTVRAPFDGMVTEVMVEAAEWLDSSDAVARVVDRSLIVVTFPLPERYVGLVGPGDPVTVSIPFARGEAYEGRVRAVVLESTPGARTFPLLVDVQNEDGRIRSGMSATGEIRALSSASSFLAPKDAIVQTNDGPAVYAVRGGKAVLEPVELGASVAGRIQVTGELREGDRLVVRGNERLRPGAPVSVLGILGAE